MRRVKNPEKRSGKWHIAGVEVPRWTAVIGAMLLLAFGLIAAYVLLKQFAVRQPAYPSGIGGIATPTPAQRAYEPSRLISEYGVDSTPRLVFNCNHMRTGTWALLEESGSLPEGTERGDLINALCRVTGFPIFCEKSSTTAVSGPIFNMTHAECKGEGGGAVIYAFYAPTCGASKAQRPIVEQLAAEFPEALEVRFICVPLTEVDRELCAIGVAQGEYDE